MIKFESIIRRRRRLIVEEADVIGVLIILDDIKQHSKFHTNLDMEIGKCGCDLSDMWYVECNFANDQWREFIETLSDFDYNLVLSAYEYYYVKEKKVEGQK